jgi:hypothetical protein
LDFKFSLRFLSSCNFIHSLASQNHLYALSS